MKGIILLFILLLTALLFDISCDKIPNPLTLGGYLMGVVFTCYASSYSNAIHRIVVSFAVLAVLFILFSIGTVGAGDIKLLMMMCTYVDLNEFLIILLFSLVLAAAVSLCKMIKYNILWARIGLFVSYLQQCIRDREIYPYDNSLVGQQVTIHMAVPIFIGFCIWAGLYKIGGFNI